MDVYENKARAKANAALALLFPGAFSAAALGTFIYVCTAQADELHQASTTSERREAKRPLPG